jgi:NADH:ubiquinone oxidoreductase subunit 6 (subunit J)
MPIEYIFIFFCLIIVGSAGFILFTKNVVHAVFMLLFTFLGVAAIFVFAGADFMAVAQIMVYVGGILVLLVFGVLLTNKSNRHLKAQSNNIETNNYNRIIGGLLGIGVFSTLFYIFTKIPFARLEGQHFEFYEPSSSTVKEIGRQLVLSNSLPLEAIGILLIGALIGAGFIAKSTIADNDSNIKEKK